MMDVMQRALMWIATWELVGLLAGALASVGVPASIAPLLVIGLIFLAIYKIGSDRFMFQRWAFKLRKYRR